MKTAPHAGHSYAVRGDRTGPERSAQAKSSAQNAMSSSSLN
jgi:hypothetical protein